MDEISPTRMNLLSRRSQLEMASRGVELLEKKRDALVNEFFANVHEALEARRQLYQTAQEAHRALMLAKSFDGPETVEALSFGMPVRFTAQAEVDNVWGTRVPRLAIASSQAATMSPLAVGGRTIAAQAAFHRLCQVLIEVANREARLRRIAGEIKKTARRVNALQQAVIPGIRAQIRAIQQALDQQEQEDIFRLKRIKGKIEAHSP
ncbi:MAG: V-type ATP synthase subunit D [Desulfobaccales bacterium]